MPLLAIIIVLLFFILLLAFILAKKFEKVKKVFLALKRKLLYNAPLRYVL